MVQNEDFSGPLEEVSDLKVKAVSHRHLGRVHLANQAGVIATKGWLANTEGDIRAALVEKIGLFRLDPQPPIQVTIWIIVAGLETRPQHSLAVSDVGVLTIVGTVDSMVTGLAMLVQNVEKCTKLQPTEHEAPLHHELQDQIGLVDTNPS